MAECVVEEAEYIIPIISDWLELDASDDWVRHDAEIVSRLPFRSNGHSQEVYYALLVLMTSRSFTCTLSRPSSNPRLFNKSSHSRRISMRNA